MTDTEQQRPPQWFALVCVVFALSGILGPMAALYTPDEGTMRTLLWLLPAYSAATSICAWKCYTQRRELAWILLGVGVLAVGGIIAAVAVSANTSFVTQ